jgi:autotransporter-associated beta strand protein
MTAAGGLALSTYNATCTFLAGDLDGGAVSNNFVMEKYNGASWSRAASTSISGSTVTGSGFTSFSDFAVGEPAPVSTSPAGVGGSSPASVGRGNTTLLTVTVTPGTFPTSTGLAVTVNLTNIGGAVAQTFYDDASHGDVTSGDNIFSCSTNVSLGTSVGAKSLSAAITDAQSRSGSATISVTVVGVVRTWSGGGANDSIATAANWTGGISPISPEDGLTFTGSTRTTPSLDSSATTPGLVFDSGASSFTLGATGGSTLTMNGGTGITNDSANGQTVNLPLVLGSAQTIKANGAGTLTIGSTVANGGNLLTLDGANNSAINGAVSGGGGLTKVANGTLTLAGNNSYGGATTISGGTLTVSGGSAIPDASAVTLTPGGSATLNVSASESIGSLTGAGTVALGANNLTVTGSATTTNGGTFTGSGKLVQAGVGTLMLTNSGALGSSFIARVEAGTVELNNGGAAITNLLSAGNKVELAGGTLKLSGNVQANIGINFSSLDIYSDSTLSLNRNSTAQSSTSPNLGFPLDFKGNANLAFAYNDRITNGTTTFSAAAHLLEGHAKLTLGAYAVTISGPIGESGGSYSLTKDGAGQLNLSAINTYSGNTTNLAGIIALNSTSTLGSGTLVLAGGDVLSTSTRASAPITNPILLTASGSSTIYGDSTSTSARIFPLSGTLTGTSGTLRIGNKATVANSFQARLSGGGFTFARPLVVGDVGFDSATGSSLLVFYNDNTTGPQIFTGVISGSAAGGILRTAPSSGTGGITVLAGDNTFAGGITNSGGYLGVGLDSTPTSGVVTSGPLGSGTLEFQVDPNVGIFAYGGARTIGNRIFLNGSGGTLNVLVGGTDDLNFTGTWNVGNSSKFLNVTNTGLTTISGIITNSGTGIFTKTGTGTLILSGNNLYNGTMTNAAGTLFVHGNNYSNSIVVASGATLGGNGLIKSVTVNAGGVFAPGASVGKLTVTNLTLAATATNVFEFDAGAVTNDTVLVFGTLTAGSSKFVVNVSNGSLPIGTYRVLDYGSKSGSFNGIVAVGSGSVSGGIKVDEATAGQVNLIVRANSTPVANNDSFTFNQGVTAKMSLASLLANDTDADTDTLTVVSVDSTTANGVTLINNGTNIFFTSAVTNNDSFTYTITDGYSATSTATVNITVAIAAATGQGSGTIDTTGSNANLTFYGLPGTNYSIQVSVDAMATWSDLSTNAAPANGVISYTDTMTTNAATFYRLRYVP